MASFGKKRLELRQAWCFSFASNTLALSVKERFSPIPRRPAIASFLSQGMERCIGTGFAFDSFKHPAIFLSTIFHLFFYRSRVRPIAIEMA